MAKKGEKGGVLHEKKVECVMQKRWNVLSIKTHISDLICDIILFHSFLPIHPLKYI